MALVGNAGEICEARVIIRSDDDIPFVFRYVKNGRYVDKSQILVYISQLSTTE
jgi:hypothetical protein